MKTLLVDESGKPPVLIRYHVNLIGEVEARFPDWIYRAPSRLKYYNRVLIQHMEEMESKTNIS